MPKCSICHTKESAQLVNEFLFAKKKKLQEIADACGFSKSAVFRHSKSSNDENCPYNFQSYRASLIKGKKDSSRDGRMIVKWDDGTMFVHHSQEFITSADVRADDFIFIVKYRSPRLVHLGNPRAVPLTHENLDQFLEAALLEDLERSKLPAV